MTPQPRGTGAPGAVPRYLAPVLSVPARRRVAARAARWLGALLPPDAALRLLWQLWRRTERAELRCALDAIGWCLLHPESCR